MKPIITANWTFKIFNQENLVILDARTGKDARENYLQNHIKSARFIDLDKDLAEIGENAAFGEDILAKDFKICRDFTKFRDFWRFSHCGLWITSMVRNAAARLLVDVKIFGIEKVQVLEWWISNGRKSRNSYPILVKKFLTKTSVYLERKLEFT